MKRRLSYLGIGIVLALAGVYGWFVAQARIEYGAGMELLARGDYVAALARLDEAARRPLSLFSGKARQGASQALGKWFGGLHDQADLDGAIRPALLLFASYADTPQASSALGAVGTWPAESALRLAQALREKGLYTHAKQVLRGIAEAHPTGQWATIDRPQITIMSPDDGVVFTEGDTVVLRAVVTSHWEPNERLTVEWVSDMDGTLHVSKPDSDGRVEFVTAKISVHRDSAALSLGPGTHTLTIRAMDSAKDSAETSLRVTMKPRIDVRVPVGDYNQGSLSVGSGSGTFSSSLIKGPPGLKYKHLGFDSKSRLVHYQIEADSAMKAGSYWVEVQVSSSGRQVETRRLQVDVFTREVVVRGLPTREPEADIENKAHLTIRLVLQSPNPMVIEIPPGETRRIRLVPGRTCYTATTPSDPKVTPASGCYEFKEYSLYTWTFFIRNIVTTDPWWFRP